MEKIDIKTFCSLMFESGKYTANYIYLLKDGKSYAFERSPLIELSDCEANNLIKEKAADYLLTEDNTDNHVMLKYNTAAGYLEENGFVTDGMLTVKDIESYGTLAEFKAYKDFEYICMAELLQKYADCDEFSLTGEFGGNDEENYHIDWRQADEAYRKIEEEQYELCRSQYDVEVKKGEVLPDFDSLYNEILAEVEELYALYHNKRRFYPCDMFIRGEMKHKEDSSAMWHCYHAAQFLHECKSDLDERMKSKLVTPLDSVFTEKELYKPLKPYINRIQVTYCWHCTTSGALARVYYIKLNDVTKQWLLQFKDDYALEGLDDLAFYKDGKLCFSSCTHEGFHSDLVDKN